MKYTVLLACSLFLFSCGGEEHGKIKEEAEPVKENMFDTVGRADSIKKAKEEEEVSEEIIENSFDALNR